jgi:hypothetical protein
MVPDWYRHYYHRLNETGYRRAGLLRQSIRLAHSCRASGLRPQDHRRLAPSFRHPSNSRTSNLTKKPMTASSALRSYLGPPQIRPPKRLHC